MLVNASCLASFGVGEHHRQEYLDAAPAIILAAADRTKRIRLNRLWQVVGVG